MSGHRAKWLGKRNFGRIEWSFVAYLYKALVSLYLFYSALSTIADITGVYTLGLVMVWFVLVTPLPLNGHVLAVLSKTQRRHLNWALVLGGAAIEMAGHPSALMMLVIVTYGALIVGGRDKSTGLKE